MIEYHPNEDMWEEYLDPQYLYCFATNGKVKNNGELVMGVGTALKVKEMHPGIPAILGDLVLTHGNIPFLLPHNLVSFPTKIDWKDPADEATIRSSIGDLAYLLEMSLRVRPNVKMPLPGAGAGGLSISQAMEILESSYELVDPYGKMNKLEVYYYE